MILSKDDKVLLLRALSTEAARVRRAVNAESNQAIKEILAGQEQAVQALYGRVHNEVAK